MTPHLLGVAEIAAMLGVTRQRVNQLIQSPDFPAPEAELSAGRIWTREAIESWVAAHPDRVGALGGASFADFSPEARAVVIRAQEEARTLRHDRVGTEHLLLALLSDAAPTVRQRLSAAGIDRSGLVAAVTAHLPARPGAPTGHIPFTPRARDALAAAAEGAPGQVEPRHVVLAVAGRADGMAAELLRDRTGLGQEAMLAEVARSLDIEPAELAVTGRAPHDGELRCSFCGQRGDEVGKLITGPGTNICDTCVDLCNRIVHGDLSPRRDELAQRLDRLTAELDQLRRDVEEGS